MDRPRGLGIGDIDFIGRDPHDGAVALVQGVDVVDALAADAGEFDGPMREVRPEGAGEGAEGGCYGAVEFQRDC